MREDLVEAVPKGVRVDRRERAQRRRGASPIPPGVASFVARLGIVGKHPTCDAPPQKAVEDGQREPDAHDTQCERPEWREPGCRNAGDEECRPRRHDDGVLVQPAQPRAVGSGVRHGPRGQSPARVARRPPREPDFARRGVDVQDSEPPRQSATSSGKADACAGVWSRSTDSALVRVSVSGATGVGALDARFLRCRVRTRRLRRKRLRRRRANGSLRCDRRRCAAAGLR